MVTKKVFILTLVYYISWIHNGLGEIILTDDREYDVIHFKVPRVVWNQALHPTPVLKSSATIVLPIHVSDDNYDFEDEEDEVVEDVVNDATQSVVETTVSSVQIAQDPVSSVNPVSTEQSPTVQDEQPPLNTEEEITGQVVRFPCSCVGGQCGCCTGSILERIRMKACGNISFVPEDFVFDVRLNINNNTVVRRRVSASDPPPICFNPRRAPFVQVCAEISNIRIRNRNAFACLDIKTDIAGFPIYSASFRCFGLGSSGVQTGLKPKPVSSGPKPVNLFGSGNSNDNDGGILSNVFGGGGDGLFGDGLFGGGSEGGPFDAIGDAVGDFFDGRGLN